MTSKREEIKDRLQGMQRGPWVIIEGKVTRTYPDTLMVDVRLDEGPEMFNIKLRAVADGKTSGMVCMPKVGSDIVFGRIRGENDLILIQASELETVSVNMGTTTLEVSEEGIQIKKGTENLLQVIVDFIQELQNVVVNNGVTPNVAALELIKTRAKSVLV